MPKIQFDLSSEEDMIVDVIRAKLRFGSKSDVLKYMIRHYGIKEGLL